MGSLLLEMTKDLWGQKKQHLHFPFFGIMKRLGQSRFWDKNASAGNRTRVDSLEGYNSTTKPPMLVVNNPSNLYLLSFLSFIQFFIIINIKG